MLTSFKSLRYIGLISLSLYLLSLAIPFQSHIPIIILSIMGFLLLITTDFDKRFRIFSSIYYPLSSFLFSILISMLISSDFKRSLVLSLQFIPGLLILFIIIETFDSNSIYRLYFLLSILAITISIHALIIAAKMPDNIPTLWIKNMGNPNIIVPNDLILLTIIIPYSLSLLMNRKTSSTVKFLSVLSVILSVCTVVIYQSRGGLLLIIISFIYIIIISKYSVVKSIAFITITIGFITDILSGSNLISKITGIWSTRVLYWLIAMEMFKDAPCLGHGLHTYATLYAEYKNRIKIPEWIAIDDRLTSWAHNLYLEVLSEQGIIGFLSLIALFFLAFRIAWKNCRSGLKEYEIPEWGAFLSFLNFAIACAFELSFIRYWVVIIFFSLLGIIVSLQKTSEPIRREP